MRTKTDPKSITWEQLSQQQQRILEDAYSGASMGLRDLPIYEHVWEQRDSDTARLTDMGLLHRVLIMAGFRHNEYGYVITEAGKALVSQTEQMKKRAERNVWAQQYHDGKITMEQFLDLLDGQK